MWHDHICWGRLFVRLVTLNIIKYECCFKGCVCHCLSVRTFLQWANYQKASYLTLQMSFSPCILSFLAPLQLLALKCLCVFVAASPTSPSLLAYSFVHFLKSYFLFFFGMNVTCQGRCNKLEGEWCLSIRLAWLSVKI